jgi:hypothetical protein
VTIEQCLDDSCRRSAWSCTCCSPDRRCRS